MMKKKLSKILVMLLVVTVISVLPINTISGLVDFLPDLDLDNDGKPDDDYYKVISKQDWELAPGINETEIVLNNSEGSQRQVVHSVKVDLNNPYAKVIPGYKGMIPTPGNYGVEATSTQAKNAEALGYGNVVAATNAMLSWYDDAYYKANPSLIGEPLGYNILNGYYYENSHGPTYGCNNVLVINYDEHPDTGEKRPEDMPKVTMRPNTSPLTGWEEQAVSVWGWLVKPDTNGVPKNMASENHVSGFESRTFVGVTAEGEIVMSVVDGRQAPYSTGFNMYEMGEYMLKMGCIYAANCDGGGSTTFVSERPGEDLKVNCSLSDGGERPTTNTLLVISTAPADGTFTRATINTDYDYYTPGSTVMYSVLGTDAIGNKVAIPSDVSWSIKEEGMGFIKDGVFTSNGSQGKVTAQMIYEEEVVGECSITIASPDKLSFTQPIVTIPFGKKAMIPVKATFGGGLYEIGLSPDDVTITSSNPALGTVNGLHFVGASKGTVLEGELTHIVVTLKSDTSVKAEVDIKLGEASVVMWDFENGQEDIDEWNCIVIRNPGEDHRDFYHKLSLADRNNGQVHDGNYSMRLETNGLSSKDVHSKQYAYVRLGLKDQKITLENARSIGFWLYVPEDNIQCWVQGFYKYDTNGDGIPDTLAEVNLMNSEYMYYNVDESGWHYLSMDVSNYEKIDLTYSSPFDADPSDGAKTGDTDEFFLVLIFHKSINNILWQTNGSINGPFTYYIDNITVDYSEVVDDREAPIFDSVILHNNGAENKLGKHTYATTTSNILDLTAYVSDATYRVDGTGTKHMLTNYTGLNVNSIKTYVDGVEVPYSYIDGEISITNIAVADGYHRVKFEICDMAGNKSTVVRLVKVESGVKASTIQVVPADPTLVEKDRLDFGSIFWMNVLASNLETIEEVTTVIDLNNVNHWQLDHMILADGFTSDYSINKETNTATITFTRTGNNYMVGEAILAQIPIRIIYFDTDMKIPGYTAETVWTKYTFWPHDLKVDVDMGKITYVEGYKNPTLGVFSNEKFQVNTEMYTDFQSMGNDPYFLEHKTTHVHVVESIADKAATCTQPGYSGRTYCDICKSVVDWGTTIPATSQNGHVYEIIDGILKCSCGDVFNGVYIDGKKYINGVIVSDGWYGELYYLDGSKLTGVHVINDKYYNFGEDGICPNKYPMSAEYWQNENGEWFYMNVGVPVKGYNNIYPNPSFFDTNTGVAFHGEMVIGGETCIFDKGVFVESTSADVLLAGLCGYNAFFVLYEDGTFVLSGEGPTYDYISTGKNFQPVISWKNRPWGNQLHLLTQSIKKIYIGKDITHIGDYTFNGAHQVTELIFEEGSKITSIGSQAFNYTHKLDRFELPDGLKTMKYASFGYNLSLEHVYIPESCKIEFGAFVGCDTAKLEMEVEKGSSAELYASQYGFKAYVRPYVPKIIASGSCGVNATWALDEYDNLSILGCGAMTDYTVFTTPWWDYRNNIKTITICKDITRIGAYAFGWCQNVSTVTFEDGSNVASIGRNAFHYILKLKNITLPETLKTIGFAAFGYGEKLEYIYIPGGVTFIDNDAFLNKSSTLKLYVEEGTYSYDYAISNGYSTVLRPYVPKIIASGSCGVNATWALDEYDNLSILGSGAMTDYTVFTTPWWDYRNNIKTITICKDITRIGAYAFGWCQNVSTVTFEDGSNVASIGRNAFHYILKLKNITLPETLKTIGFAAFGYGEKLEYIYIPGGVTFIDNDAFLNKSSTLKLYVEEGTYSYDYAISNGYSTVLRPYVPKIIASGSCGVNATWALDEYDNLSILGSGAMTDYTVFTTPWWDYRNNIKTITICKDITRIGAYAFGWCQNVSTVTFEDGSNVASIGRNAFHYILKLKNITLPETLKTIGFAAFGYGEKLEYIYIPGGVTFIDNDAFLNKSSTLKLYVEEGTYSYDYAISNGIKINIH